MNRKDDHVLLALRQHLRSTNDFDRVHFIHHNFSELALADVSLATSFDGIDLSVPFFINAMTGGSAMTAEINEKLAYVAQKTNIAIASGSMSAAFKDAATLPSFTIINEVNPNGIKFANLQASATIAQAQQAIDWLAADALQLHVNVAQEIIMAEGDRDFKGWLTQIKAILNAIDVPVIVKEVGFGFSKEAIGKLVDLGVKTIDVSGKGGTNFAQIENLRNDQLMDYMNNWGQSTVCSLLEAQDYEINIIASGGVRNMLDVAKALALGAKAVGISGMILYLVETVGVDATIKKIESFKEQLKRIMILLNASTVADLQKCACVFDQSIVNYANQRQLDLRRYQQ